MAVSMIIGGILSPNNGGKNTATDMIEGIIARDIAAQESDKETKLWSLSQRRGIIAENLGDAGDLASRQAAARAAAYGMAIEQATARRSRMTAPAEIERTNQIILGLEGKYVDAASQFEAARAKAELDRVSEERDYKLRRWQVSQGDARLKEDKRQFDAGMLDREAERKAKADESRTKATSGTRELAILDRGQPITNPDGTPMQARDKDEAKAASNQAVAYRLWRSKLARYREMAAESRYGGWGPNDKRHLEAVQLREELITDWKDDKKLGALSGGDRTMAETVIPPPNSWTDSDPTSRIDQMMGLADNKVDEYMGSYGYQGSYSRDYLSAVDTFKPKDETAEKKRAPVGLPPPGKPVGYIAPPERVEPGSPADESIRRLRESRR
jgi:hypothetical protein